MSHLETIAIHFVGYNLLHGAVKEVTGSLKLVKDMSAQTGASMVDWNARTQLSVDAVGTAYERYAVVMRQSSIAAMEAQNRVLAAELKYSGVVEKSTATIVNAAQDQAIAYKRIEEAHLRVVAAAELQAKAEQDLGMIASRAYAIEAERADLNTAANNRLATAVGMRAIAEKDAELAALALAAADQRAAIVAAEVGEANTIASNKIAIAKEKQALASEQSAAKQIAASQAIKVALADQALVATQTALIQSGASESMAIAQSKLTAAQARYAEVVTANKALVVNAAQEQAIAMQRLEMSHAALIGATQQLAAVEVDLDRLSARIYPDQVYRVQVLQAANERLTMAVGQRAIAEQEVTDASLIMASADRAAASVAEQAAIAHQVAAAQITAAYAEQAVAARESAMVQVTSLKNISGSAMGVGGAFLIGGAVLTGAMALAARETSQFESKIILLHTQARVAISDFPVLRQGILDMAGSVGFSSDKLADALFLIESVAGGSYTAAHALDQLKAAAMGAAVGHADLVQTANALASVMAVFPTMLPTQAMGQLDAIVGQGKMTMEDLNGALRTGILATLHSSGISLADFGGALATMTDYAIPAIQAANSLRMAVYLMTAPTQASDKVLREFGLTAKEVSSAGIKWTDAFDRAGIRHAQLADDLRKPGGIIIAMQDLRSHFIAAGLSSEGQAEAIYKAFGGGKMGKAIVTLYENISGGAGVSNEALQKMGFTLAEIATLHDRLIQKTALINQQTNLLGANFAYLTANDPVQMWKDFTAAINALIVSLGYAFIPTLMAIAHAVLPIIKNMTDWIQTHQELVGKIAGVVLGFTLLAGVGLMIVGIIGSIAAAILAFGFAAPAIGLATLVFGALVAIVAEVSAGVLFLSQNWGLISNFWDTRVAPSAKRLWNIITDIWTAISNGIATTKPLWDAAFNDLNTRLNENGSVWDDASKAFENFSKDALTFIKSDTFAAIVATFSVSLPVAFGLTIDALLVMADVGQMAFTALYYSGKLALDLMTGNLPQLARDGEAGMAEMGRLTGRFTKDQDRLFSDMQKVVDGTYAQMWQDIYNQTKQWTAKLGDDGAQQMQTAMEKIMNTGNIAMKAGEKNAYNQGVITGKNIADGVAAGMDARREAIESAANTLVERAVRAAQAASKSHSPSLLFAEKVGKPIPQGIWMGVDHELPALSRNMAKMFDGMIKPPKMDGSVQKIFASFTSPTIHAPIRSMTPDFLPRQPLPNFVINTPRPSPSESTAMSISQESIKRNAEKKVSVKTETNIKLMLEEKVLAEAIDKRTYETMEKGYNVS